MEMETISHGSVSDKIADKFLCRVCLDLVYKPVVLFCGHAFCFWCVHKSMNGHRESHCPICRHIYYYFPTICDMLHALLLKIYPSIYKRRENETLEEEKGMGIFSPKMENFTIGKYKMDKNIQHDVSRSSEMVVEIQKNSNDISDCSLIDDLLCAVCEQLIFRPVVLNCGHVYCESCLAPADGIIKCQICQISHSREFPKVYSELDQFVVESFTKEYSERKNTVQLKQKIHFQHEYQPTKVGKNDTRQFPTSGEKFLEWYAGNCSKIHVGVGCDYCGMYPIIGDRYRCKDCKEIKGFDLCGDCCSRESKRPGRFNQQHTSDHTFEIIKSNRLYNLISELLGSQSETSYPPHLLVPENGENTIPHVAELAREDTENAENVAVLYIENHKDDYTPRAM